MSESEKEPSGTRLLEIGLPDAEELDDEEFQIPRVETAPTLESILSEDTFPEEETSSYLQDDVIFEEIGIPQLASEEPQEEGNPKQILTPARQWVKDPLLPGVGQDAVLLSVTLKRVSAQISSAMSQVRGGEPTALAVCGTIAVGTTTGQLLVFDASQTLKLCLGSQALGTQHGPISALGFKRDGTNILSGFSRGQILQWDVQSGKLLRSISNVVPVGTAVSAVKFTSDPTVAVCSDSAGSVYELHLKRSLGAKTWDSRCLFNSEKDAVRCIAPLCFREEFAGHPATQLSLLAMVSLRKLLMVCQKPMLRVIHASPLLKTHAGCVPSLSWCLPHFNDLAEPVLAFCLGACVSVYQVQFGSDDLSVVKLHSYHVAFEIQNFKWLNFSTLLMLDTGDGLHVIDRESGENLQDLELENFRLVDGSTLRPDEEATGTGAVSTPVEYQRTTHRSVCSYRGKVFLLGTKSVQVVSLKTWEERLDFLVKQEKYEEAFSLAWTFYEGKAKAVVGLSDETQLKKAQVADKVAEMVLSYLELSLRSCPERGMLQVMVEHFQKTIPHCVSCCIKFNQTGVLFGAVYEKLVLHAVALGVLFECLQPHISIGRLRRIPPLVMKDMVAYHEEQGMMGILDTLIPHLDVTTLDLHQVVSLSRKHRIYNSLIFVFNNGMRDYTTPIEEMVGDMVKASHTEETDERVTVGNKLLVYISCCLTGRAYPFGVIPDDMVQTVKTQVFTCLTRTQMVGVEPSEGPYPFIRTLLQYNTREFLNVLALAFEELEQDRQLVELHQRIIDVLQQVMLESTDFTPWQIGSLFTFLARQLARAENALFVDHQLFHQALDFLCNPGDTTQHAERQQALLDLLQAGGIAYFDENKLLSMAETVQFCQVSEFVFEQKRLYHRIVVCYLKDPMRKDQTLDYLLNVATSADLSDEERLLFQNEIFCNLQELLALSPSGTASLVLRHFKNGVPLVIETLQQDASLLFDFLHGVFDPRVDPWPFKDACLMDHSYHELYLELLCQRHPDRALDFVRLSDMYRPEEAIRITQKHAVSDALAYLLERQGNTQEAFSVLFQSLALSLQSLASITTSVEARGGAPKRLQAVRSMVKDLIAFCQRASGTLDSRQREDLWFPLLDVLRSPPVHTQGSFPTEVYRDIKGLTKNVLEGMASYIPLVDILQRLMQNPVCSAGKYGEIKNLISAILDAYIYEKTLLEATRSLLSQDQHWSLCHLRSAVTRGLAPAHKRCGICSQQYSSGAGVVLFSCGHVYHHSCMQSILSQQESSAEEWACAKCQPSTKKWTPIRSVKPAPDPKCFDLDCGQIAASDCLRRAFKNPSRISVLMELTSQTSRSLDSCRPRTDVFGQSRVSELEEFKLNLAPPPVTD